MRIFYSDSSEAKTIAALLLDIDPTDLVRGAVYTNKDHCWHMETIAEVFRAMTYRIVET